MLHVVIQNHFNRIDNFYTKNSKSLALFPSQIYAAIPMKLPGNISWEIQDSWR